MGVHFQMYYNFASNFPYNNSVLPCAYKFPNNNPKKPIVELDFIPADTPFQYLTLLASGSKKLIRTFTDWRNFVKENPLHIDLELLNRFGKELLFHADGGFVSANYQVIGNSLSFEQFRKLFGYLGISMKFFEDHVDYICEAGDCKAYSGYICNPSTCGRLINFGQYTSNVCDYCVDPYGRPYPIGGVSCFPNGIYYECLECDQWVPTGIPCSPPSSFKFGM